MGTHRIREFALSTELLGVLLFAFAAGFPPFDDATEVDLTLHMLQHFLIVFAGVLIAYPHYGRRLVRTDVKGLLPGVLLVTSALLVVFWHFPIPWDDAVLNPGIHVVEHLSFLFVGLLCGSWLLRLSDSGKIGALLAAFFGHMGLAVALVAPFGGQVYSLYSLADQVLLGWILLLSGPFLMIGVAYVILRNPEWLNGFSGSTVSVPTRRKTPLDGVHVPSWVAPLLTLVLAGAFVGYFGMTAYALAATPQAQVAGPRVYIVESPVSWQYSPQQIRVVLGVNSTVTWISHSISYDTVTGRAGDINSGSIPPGGTFSFTFTSPGVYEYYCQFHPWMTGTVTVVQ